MSKPLLDKRQTQAASIIMWVFVLLPFVALILAIPVVWGWGLSVVDIALGGILYVIAAASI